jgi:hypothetical protein
MSLDDRPWLERVNAAEEDAWQHAQMMQDLADEHISRWAGAPKGRRNSASPDRQEDAVGSPPSRRRTAGEGA